VEGEVRRAYFVDDGEIALSEFADEPQKDRFVFLRGHRILLFNEVFDARLLCLSL
jgi:hypothetical protein